MPKQYSNYKRKQFRKKKVYVNRTKKMVTGSGPTLLEKIASYAGPVATLAKAIIPVVAAINTEAKYHDLVVGSLLPTLATPSIASLSIMAQGLTDKTRIGNSILAKDINIKYSIYQDWGTIDTKVVTRLRVTIFIDKQQAGVPPTIAQLMETTSNNMSMSNKNFTDRFVILKDKFITINRMADCSTGGIASIQVQKYFKSLDFHCRYIGTGGASADAGNNTIYIMFWPADNLGQTAISLYSRLNYTDN